MLVSLMSDLHLEIDPTFLPENPGADVLVLAGDVCVADFFRRSEDSPYHDKAKVFRYFFEHVCREWRDVVYVSGNHESYHGRIDRTVETLRDSLGDLKNLHLLDDDYVQLGNVKFLGGTLWTDLDHGSPVVECAVEGCMNDYRMIQIKDRDNYRRFRALDGYRRHKRTLEFLKDEVSKGGTCVVVTHHAPSRGSVHPRYEGKDAANRAYFSDLDEVIHDWSNVPLWCHGHVHDSFEYMVGNTMVVANPKGYCDENEYFNPDLVMEL